MDITAGKLLLDTTKTAAVVAVPLPDVVLDALAEIENETDCTRSRGSESTEVTLIDLVQFIGRDLCFDLPYVGRRVFPPMPDVVLDAVLRVDELQINRLGGRQDAHHVILFGNINGILVDLVMPLRRDDDFHVLSFAFHKAHRLRPRNPEIKVELIGWN